VGASDAGLLVNFVVATGVRSHETVALHWQADATPSNRRTNTLLMTAFLGRGHRKLESSTRPPPSSWRRRPMPQTNQMRASKHDASKEGCDATGTAVA
jgi:hypothetical protein